MDTNKIENKNAGPSFLKPPPPVEEEKIVQTIHGDIVVVGAGYAGLSAAVRGAQLGAKVILLEKGAVPASRGSDVGSLGVSSEPQRIDPMDAQRAIMQFGSYRNDQRIVALWANNSVKVTDWLLGLTEELGLKAKIVSPEGQDIPGAPYPYFPTRVMEFEPDYDLLPQAKSMFGFSVTAAVREALVAKAKKLSVEMHFQTRAMQLEREGEGSVRAVIAQAKDGSYIRFAADKGVILCAGDYGNDPEMREYYIPSSYAITRSSYPGKNTGDGHKMGLWVGADIDEAPHCPMYFDNACAEDHRAVAPPVVRQSWLSVNNRGERFVNEDLPFGMLCNAQRQQPDHVRWVLFDDKWKEEGGKMGLIACKRWDTGMDHEKALENMMERGLVHKADTLEELAEIIQVPYETLKGTIARYNDLAKKGRDEDFGKRAACLTTVEKAPFYAFKMGIALLVTLGGLKVDTKLRVLDKQGNAIPGLYAAGNNSGGFYAEEYPITLPGNSHGRALTFGYLAAENIMQDE